MSAADDFLKL